MDFTRIIIACDKFNNRAVRYKMINATTKESDSVPGDMNFKQLLTKTSQEIEAEYNLLDLCLKPNLSMVAATMPENRFKNRYINTLPCKIRNLIIYIFRTLH